MAGYRQTKLEIVGRSWKWLEVVGFSLNSYL